MISKHAGTAKNRKIEKTLHSYCKKIVAVARWDGMIIIKWKGSSEESKTSKFITLFYCILKVYKSNTFPVDR